MELGKRKGYGKHGSTGSGIRIWSCPWDLIYLKVHAVTKTENREQIKIIKVLLRLR